MSPAILPENDARPTTLRLGPSRGFPRRLVLSLHDHGLWTVSVWPAKRFMVSQAMLAHASGSALSLMVKPKDVGPYPELLLGGASFDLAPAEAERVTEFLAMYHLPISGQRRTQ